VTRRNNMKYLSALVGATLLVAACSSDDNNAGEVSGDSTVSTVADTTADTSSATSAATETSSVDTTETSGDTSGTDSSTPAADGDVGTVGGSGCGTPHGPYDDPGEPTGEVRVAWNDPLLSFNTLSSRGNATANANPLYLMGLGSGGGFTYYDQDLNLVNNDQFGTCTVESLDPLTVTYTINDGVTWSDGTPVDAADLVLAWAATSTNYNDGEAIIAPNGDTVEADADGNPVVLDPSGAEVPFADIELVGDNGDQLPEGYTYKEAAGVSFDASSESLSLVTQFPEISEDGRSATITWDSFYVDYQVGGLGVGVPAHVVAKNALGIEDPTEGKQAIIDAFKNDDTASIKPISEFWNTGFDATSLPEDEGVYLSAGPYVLTAYDELSQMTFEANPDYTWGPKPKVKTIVYRVIGDPTAAVQALENEEIDIIQPQSTADILSSVQGLSDRGVEVITGDTGTYEHVDLIFDNGGPFDPATYGGDEEKALKVRQAFLKTIPRQDIIDRLIVPLNPNAKLRESFTTVVGAPAYDTIAAENGSSEYDQVDLEGAKALLAEVGVTTPIDVRFLFAANNPRRTNEYDLIAASAAEAGFNVIDGSSPTWGQDLSNSTLYDASLFGWQSTAVAVADSEANFRTGGQNNYGGYSSDVVDGLYDQLKASTDPAEQQKLLVDIEKELWADGFGVTIFQHPGLTAYNSTYVNNVSTISLAPTVFWDVWDWEAAS
jgi:peptide/nickel transport system substrate-binding protein